MEPRTGQLVIRTALPGDLPDLLALYAHLNPSDPPIDPALAEARFAEIMADPRMTVFLGFCRDKAVSSITLVVIPNLTRGGASYALIENVVTHADHRMQGHARALIRDAIARAWQEGCYKVMLLTGSTNPATLRFYENCGFARNKTGFQIRRAIAQ